MHLKFDSKILAIMLGLTMMVFITFILLTFLFLSIKESWIGMSCFLVKCFDGYSSCRGEGLRSRITPQVRYVDSFSLPLTLFLFIFLFFSSSKQDLLLPSKHNVLFRLITRHCKKRSPHKKNFGVVQNL